MSSVIYGNSSWQNESGANTSGGWNTAGSIWGSSGNDTFTFENQSWINGGVGLAANGSIGLLGRGGTDVIDFSSSTAAVTFNFAQLQTGSTYSVLGSTGFNDTFMWNGTQTLPTVDGQGGTNDALNLSYATAGVSFSMNDAKIINIESFVGSAYNDTFSWNGLTFPASLDGAGGTSDVLTAASSTTALALNVNDSKITNIESFVGSSLSDAFNWSGAGPGFTLNGGAGTDTLQLAGGANDIVYILANAHLSLMDFVSGTAYNDNVFWAGADTFSFNLGTGTDTLDISSSTAGRQINLYATQFQGIEVVNGSNYADTLRGTTAQETLIGGNGADILWGGTDTAIDSLVGNAGSDTYYWARGQGNDIIADGGTFSTSVVDTLVLSDVALADLSLGTNLVGSNPAIYRTSNTNIAFDLTKDGVESKLTMDLANDNVMYRQIVLTDATFNLFVANDTAGSLTGTSMADLIYGSQTAAYTLNGGVGADTLIGGSANDTFIYSSADVFYGMGNSADLITAATATAGVEINLYDTAKFKSVEYALGSSLNDTLRGATTSDSLAGGAGDDILWGGEGTTGFDSMQGGAGADTFWFSANQGNDVISTDTTLTYQAADVVRLSGINFSDLTISVNASNDAVLDFVATTGYAGELLISSFANVNELYGATNANLYRLNKFVTDDKTFGLALGTSSTTTLMGSSLDDLILANNSITAGAETIDGGAGADSIYGGAGNDYVKYYAADIILSAGTGNDTLAMTTAGTMDLYTAGTTTFSGFEVLQGTSGADIIRGSSLSETINGAGGTDNIWGAGGNDQLNGGAAADTYWFTSGDGSDSIVYDAGNSASDKVMFSSVNFSDLSFAPVGASDNLVIGLGTDSLTLNNWINYTTSSSTANLSRINWFATADLTFGVAVGNDTATSLVGTSLADYIRGGIGNDTLKAGVGADSLYGGIGNDLLQYSSTGAMYDGGNDTDTLSALSSTAAVELNLYATNILNIEYLQGSSLGDILRGSDASGETLDGGKGTDILWGGKGDDTMVGGIGADTYWFGALDGSDVIANDSATTNNAGDSVNFYSLNFSQLGFSRVNSDADLKITVNADQGYTDNLVLTNWGLDTNTNRVNRFVTSDLTFGLAIGTANAESLTGTTLADYIFAGAGDDTINGGAGADTIYGNDGNDLITYKATAALLDGGAGTDTLTAAASTAAVEINLYDSKIANVEAVLGSSLADTLRGTSLGSTLSGGNGTDILWGGGAGADLLAGGNGIDTYWFGSGDGADTIAADTTNNTDYVKFYGGIDGNNIASTVVSGNNLTISLTSGDSLTLVNWALTDGSKLNNFDFGSNGVWALSVASDGTTATWTQRTTA